MEILILNVHDGFTRLMVLDDSFVVYCTFFLVFKALGLVVVIICLVDLIESVRHRHSISDVADRERYLVIRFNHFAQVLSQLAESLFKW